MEDDSSPVDRRSVLKALGGASAVAGVGGAATLFASSSALAASNFSIDGSSATTDDGEVKNVVVDIPDYVATWDGFDKPVAAVAFQDFIQVVDDNGNVTFSHKLFDNTDSPVRFSEFSSKGNGSDGWGGPGEYATVSSPSTHGEVHADIQWKVLSDGGEPGDSLSVENPGDINSTSVENASDGTNKKTTLRYIKRMYFYGENSNGDLYNLGSDDGTESRVESVADFDVTIGNQAASTSGSADGSSSIGT